VTTPGGVITAANINTELQRSSNASLNLNDKRVRQLAEYTNSDGSPIYDTTISYNNLRSKSRARGDVIYASSPANRVVDASHWDWIDMGSGTWRSILSPALQNTMYVTNSLDLRFDFSSSHLASDWNFTQAGIFMGGSVGAGIIDYRIYTIPFWNNNGPGYPAITSGNEPNSATFDSWYANSDSGWGWYQSNWVNYNNLMSIIFVLWTGTTNTAFGSYVDVKIGDTHQFLDCEIPAV